MHLVYLNQQQAIEVKDFQVKLFNVIELIIAAFIIASIEFSIASDSLGSFQSLYLSSIAIIARLNFIVKIIVHLFIM